ncbi:tRNA (guanosine(37)-N1)-methyltransferase TrmD [Candidatus Epulonipiscium fishelsonii]|uniref:tRNA (Guanosine(37)-N1)-methyltransferase TrmD n=1 Tax=Candidatus Epulonipiscium fishelsonii TaxID=77094 RepID=A0ACC8XHY5_9FIRM|nr:tRNA (guanosine(37)-N1)-methyltransferase TrmD [Epulopiscium sp. SCG-D08WGA-EpuloA1]
MKIIIMTLFPEMIEQSISHSIIGRAIKKQLLEITAINIRDFANNKHKKVDDYPFGGGVGMLIMAPPVKDCYNHILSSSLTANPPVIYMTPQGKVWNQAMAQEFSKEKEIILLCGHYEGIDQRVIDEIVTHEVSIGDYILTGGELAALVVIDSISRLVEGVLGKQESFQDESFSHGLLEYPQYTKPRVYNGVEVPEILLSGHHKNIAEYNRQKAIEVTRKKRPELLKSYL